jgi:hypothetical protein
MNAQEMLDYTLNQLDGPARERFEQELAADPSLSQTIERLERAVHGLLDDGEVFAPRTGLAERTLSFVAENRRRRTILDLVPVAVPFRWADFAVAASIFVASLLTLVPAFHRARGRSDEAGCVFNLQQLGLSLAQYATLHGHFPYAPPGHQNPVAGTFAATLHDSGLLHDLSTLDCPCNGLSHRVSSLPELGRLPRISAETPEQYRQLLGWDYAYHVGYRHDSGRVGPVPATLAAAIPLLADQPPHEGIQILEGNSPNHGRRGQNVLFSDGHSGWYQTRRVSAEDSDLYLNDERRPAPGLNPQDAVLVPSLFPFPSR